MRCTDCSRIVQPVVAVDIDGTLGDYHGHFLRFAADWTGRGLESLLIGSMSMYDGTYPFSKYCTELFDIDIATYRQVKLAYRQGGMKRTMPMIAGAMHLSACALAVGVELWVTTTRPYLSLDNIVPDTVEWLRRNEIGPYSGILFDEDKYRSLSDRVDSDRVVAVFDDLPEMYDAASSYLGSHVPVLVLGQFNSGVRRTMMSDLGGCVAIMIERVKAWREQNGH